MIDIWHAELEEMWWIASLIERFPDDWTRTRALQKKGIT